MSTPSGAAPGSDVREVVTRELRRFAVPGILGVLLLVGASLVASLAVARAQSQREAETTADWLARTVVAPRIARGLGDVRQLESLDRAFSTSVQGSDVVAVRLWNAEGVLVYSDDPRLVGESFPVPATDGTGPTSGPADMQLAQNRYLDPAQPIIEVNQRVVAADGSEYTFQINQLQDTLRQDARGIWLAFAPILVASMCLLGLLLLALAIRMARRISAELRARQDLLQHAIDASDVERRRIAADLHDGTVQQLAGLSFTLAGLASRAAAAGDQESAGVLADGAAQARNSVRELRTLLVDIYPPNLAAIGLAAALADQASGLAPRIDVTLDIADDSDLDQRTRTVLYRAAREALTNVGQHSGATSAKVSLLREGTGVRLTVSDDGHGFVPNAVGVDHLGLRLIRDLAASAGGSMNVASSSTGTTITLALGTS